MTDMGLLQIIRTWRLGKAKEIKKPPFMILSNVSLVDLATRRPMTREELLDITGVGEKKVADFGDELLRLIKSQS